MKKFRIPYFLLIAFVGAIAFSSCRSPKVVTSERVRPISTNRLIREMEENAFRYESLSIKRINCSYETQESKTSFRATLGSLRDKHIQITISKLNLPIAKLLLTPDSVKLINYFEKTYFLTDYRYLTDFVNLDLSFDLIQSILTNDLFSYRDDPDDDEFKEFESYIDSNMYVLQSIKDRKLQKVTRKAKDDKISRYLKKMDEENFIVQRLFVDPVTFKTRRLLLDDKRANRQLEVLFSAYEAIENQLYPGNIEMYFRSRESNLAIKIDLSKFSLGEESSASFAVPEKYKPMQ